jgi:hypothetical protein
MLRAKFVRSSLKPARLPNLRDFISCKYALIGTVSRTEVILAFYNDDREQDLAVVRFCNRRRHLIRVDVRQKTLYQLYKK